MNKTKAEHRLSQILPHLFATRAEYPFGGTVVKTQAFLIQRCGGREQNMWVYGSSHVGDYIRHIEELGGVNRQLLNHRDEASKLCTVLDDAPVFCHADEKEAIEQKGCVEGETYDTKVHEFGEDLVAYHTPGHAEGVTSYLWRCNEGETVLFTGDSLYSNEQGRFAHGPLV
jgi:hypothetical protein